MNLIEFGVPCNVCDAPACVLLGGMSRFMSFQTEVKAVRAWAAHTLDVPESFIEPLQLVRYTDGQQMGLLDVLNRHQLSNDMSSVAQP